MPIQGLTDLTKLGELVKAGLPNITYINPQGLVGATPTGALSGNVINSPYRATANNNSGAAYIQQLGFDASKSNSIYSDDVNTVQQEQIQYPYFIQIATGQETQANITNEIELNNPYTLFDSKYSEALLYNASWLKSDGTYYAKSVYVTAYEALVVENNTEVEAGESVTLPSGTTYVKRGLSVKLSTADDITDYDFVINTTNETFRLPLMTSTLDRRILVDKKEATDDDPSWYNLYSDGWCEQGGQTPSVNADRYTINLVKTMINSDYYVNYIIVGEPSDMNYRHSISQRALTSFTISDYTMNNSPVIWYACGYSVLTATNISPLYYYVGETVQNANLINAGVIAETKLDINASNLTEPGKTNIKNLVYPDFNNTVSLDKTLNLVQQADKDCYLHVSAESGGDLWVDICDADGVTKLSLIASDTAANVATVQTSPLIPAGTYFKVSLNVGSYHSLTKIYTKGESNV